MTRRSRFARRLAPFVTAAVLAAGCGATGPTSTAPPVTAAFETFVEANGFAAWSQAVVQLGGAGAEDASHSVRVVIAGTPEDRAQGLMGVTAVPTGTGMLFVFPERASAPAGAPAGGMPGFWMRDTLIPLDIAFARDGIIVGVATMQPCMRPPCPVTHPGVDYEIAVEVAAGALAAAGVTVGDRLSWTVTD